MFDLICQELAAIFIFFYAIHRFSKRITRCNVDKLKTIIAKATDTPIKSIVLGIVSAAFMQSNKAVSSIALTLVNAGIVGGTAIIPILFGAPIGVSATAFLVSIKWKSMEEILIIAGVILKKTKNKNVGNIVFYLGLLLFALELMTNATAVLKDNEVFRSFFIFTNNCICLFIIGMLASCILQSGALVISIITILTSCHTLPLLNAIYMSCGVIVGSSLSLIIVTLSMSKEAKKTCYVNIVFIAMSAMLNILFVPFYYYIVSGMENVGLAFAIANLISRIAVSSMALLMYQVYSSNVLRITDIMPKIEAILIKMISKNK